MNRNIDSTEKIRLLIADDHDIVLQGIRKVLSIDSRMQIVAEARNGMEVIERVKRETFDVVILDVNMPERNGWDVLMDLKQLEPRLPVIVLSMLSEDRFGLRLLKSGAAGFMGKETISSQLIKAIEKVHAGGKYFSPSLAEQMIEDWDAEPGTLPHKLFTSREFEIFTLIASGKRIKEIAGDLGISAGTVGTHKTRIFNKMKIKSVAELVSYAFKNGLIQ